MNKDVQDEGTDKNIVISVLILCYNQEQYIYKLLSSIFVKKIAYVFEVLIHDDGSSDNTIAKVKDWQNKYPDQIRLFISENRKDGKRFVMERIAKGCNVLLKQMKGKYLCLADGDDYYDNFMLVEQAINVMESKKDVVSCVFDFRYRKLGIIECETNLSEKFATNLIDEQEFIRTTYVHSGSFVFRNIFNKDRINRLTATNLVIDNVIVPFITQFGKLYYIPEVFYSYVINTGMWNNKTFQEQQVFTGVLAGVVKNIARKYSTAIKVRCYKSLEYMWTHKENDIAFEDKELLNWYMCVAYRNKDYYMYNILGWKNINLLKKMMTLGRYIFIKFTFWIYMDNRR